MGSGLPLLFAINSKMCLNRYDYYVCSGAGGVSLLQFCNLNSFRNKFILGFSIFLGLSIPQYFNEYIAINSYGPVHTGGRWVSSNSTVFSHSVGRGPLKGQVQ